MSRLKIAVFASGSGSNFQAIVDAIKLGTLDAHIELLVCDKPEATVIGRAERAGVDVFAFRPKEYGTREAYELEILKQLESRGVELIVLAGYMRIITEQLVKPYEGRMINIHPSLLPSFPGIRGIEQAMEHGVKLTGVTVHYVDGGMDTGPIIAQSAVTVEENDTIDSLSTRIHEVEHDIYPRVIQWIAEDRVQLDGRNVKVESK